MHRGEHRPTPPSVLRGLDEASEQSGVLTGFRVPLDRQPERPVLALHRLERAVGGPGRSHEARMLAYGLVVMAGDFASVTDRRSQPGPGYDVDGDLAELGTT